MRKLIVLFLFLILCLPINAFSAQAIYNRNKPTEVIGWSVYGADDDMSTGATLITELDTTYAQLAAADTIEVLSANNADTTQTVTVTGINSAGNRISEDIALNGTTFVAGTTTFKYIDQVSVSPACAGAVTVRRATGDTFIISIPIGALEATVVQHFNGEKDSYVTGWRASVTSTTGTVTFDLRWYPDDSKCLADTTDFIVLDQIALTNVLSTQYHPFPEPIFCPAGGWLAIFTVAGTDNADGSATIWGYDTKF